MHSLVRDHRRFFLATTLAGLALRLFFFFHFPTVTDDSRVYADLATNWLHHGIYGQTQAVPNQPSAIVPTDARLPGYPAFLAVVFAIFGVGNFSAVLLLQTLFDLGTCLLIADLARRTVSNRAAQIAFALACACPFLANYAAAALTETLEIFFTTFALNCTAAGLARIAPSLNPPPARSSWLPFAACGASIAACILLRPDGGILLAAAAFYFLFLLAKLYFGNRRANQHDALDAPSARQILTAAALVAIFALAPLAPWTIRNFRTLHHFQPLAPRYATEQDELAPRGFNRWVKTWIVDYSSTEEFYWNMPGDTLDADKLPNRAFDNDAQREATTALLDDYNQSDAKTMTPALDQRFAQLAAGRTHAHTFRYYVALPLTRIADMWLRPRTEILPPDPRWWEFDDLSSSSATVIALGLLNLAYIAVACLALLFRRSHLRYLALSALFLVLRSAFLGTLENPEPRYTLECYPIVILWAASFLANPFSRATRNTDTQPASANPKI